MPKGSTPPPSSHGRPSTLPQPALRRLTAMLDAGFVGRGAPTLQMLGRVLLHAAAVGAAVGLASLAFVYSLEVAAHFVLERLAGYIPLRAAGEGEPPAPAGAGFPAWAVVFLPPRRAALR